MDELVGIVPEVCHDPTLPRTDDHECPKCRNRRVCFFQDCLKICSQENKVAFLDN